jgi:cell division septal protein FtsQ
MARARFACDAAGWKLSQVEVASRRHISAKNRVRSSVLDKSSINWGIEASAIRARAAANSSRLMLI